MGLVQSVLGNPQLIIIFSLILVALFINGATDSPSAVATVIATGVLSPRVALFLAAVMNVIGTFFGGKVAITIASGVISPKLVTLPAVSAAMLAIISWGSIAWYKGLPISKSHALLAGLAGAGFASGGWEAYTQVWSVGWWNGWTKVITGLFLSPLCGFFVAWILGRIIILFFARRTPRQVNNLFDVLQVLSALAMAGSHGSNDGTKFVGVATLALILAGVVPMNADGSFPINPEIVLLCAGVIGLGTYVGGRPIIVKIGKKLGDELSSWQGFATETTSSAVIFLASSLGIPISTTHVAVSAIAGSSYSRYKSDVNWGVALEIVRGWVLTFPACWVIAWAMTLVIDAIF